MWQKRIAPRVEAGDLTVIGVVQEQHPDRARLYRQWRNMNWPIYVDALNRLDFRVVPIPVAIDETGRVWKYRAKPEDLEAFLKAEPLGDELPASFARAPKSLSEADPATLRAKGENAFLAGNLDRAVSLLQTHVEQNPEDARGQFRLGVALRRRFETTSGSRVTDAQEAVDHWTRALALQPNQYIWRRRLQQFGPRPSKPYNFYGWIKKARKEIRKRGDKPVPLTVEPRGAEILPPTAGDGPEQPTIPNPDPDGRITRDEDGLVRVRTVITPHPVRPGEPLRVRLHLQPTTAHWNNEAEPLTLSLKLPDGWTVSEGTFLHPNPDEPETKEERILEFEVTSPETASGRPSLNAYLLYNVCRDESGVCLYRRNDLTIRVTIDPDAPTLK